MVWQVIEEQQASMRWHSMNDFIKLVGLEADEVCCIKLLLFCCVKPLRSRQNLWGSAFQRWFFRASSFRCNLGSHSWGGRVKIDGFKFFRMEKIGKDHWSGPDHLPRSLIWYFGDGPGFRVSISLRVVSWCAAVLIILNHS